MTIGGSAVNGQTHNPTLTAALANLPVAPTRISPAQAAQDQVMFSDPANITGHALLDLATRYATIDITTNVNAAAGSKVMNERVTYWRLNAAIKKQAENTGRTIAEVKTDLTVARKAVGIRFNRLNRTPATTAGNAQEHNGDTAQEESDAESQDVAESPAPAPAPSGPSAPISATTTQTATIAPNPVANVQSTTTIAAQDQVTFANPNQLSGDAILNLATRYATSDIAKRVNALAGRDVMTRRTACSRLRTAVRAYAARAGLTADRVTADLTAARRAAGIRCNAPNNANAKTSQANTSESRANEAHTGDTIEEESDAEIQDTTTPAPPAFVPAPARTATIPAADQELFDNSERPFGDTLLTLAERYSNSEISKHISKKFGTDKVTLGPAGVTSRINAALKSRVVGTTFTLDQLKDNLRAARAANGVRMRAPRGGMGYTVEPAQQAVVATAPTTAPATAAAIPKAMDTEMGVAATTTTPTAAAPVPEAMDVKMAVVETETPAVATQEGEDVEMADAGNEAVQQRYTAVEMDAADALLMMFQTKGATDDEASDTEMNDAERAELITDF
jgi:hypothetical protein